MQIHPVEVRLFCVDRQIDEWMDRQTERHDKVNSRF